jgi:hypothetical protein
MGHFEISTTKKTSFYVFVEKTLKAGVKNLMNGLEGSDLVQNKN